GEGHHLGEGWLGAARRLLGGRSRQEAEPALLPFDPVERAHLPLRREHRTLPHRGQLVRRLHRRGEHVGVHLDANRRGAGRGRNRRSDRKRHLLLLDLPGLLVPELQAYADRLLVEPLLRLQDEGGRARLAGRDRAQLGAALLHVDLLFGEVLQRSESVVRLALADVLHVQRQLALLALVDTPTPPPPPSHLPTPPPA